VLDSMEFAPTPLLMPDAQVLTYPAARYYQGHTLRRNVNWMNPHYIGGQMQPWNTGTTMTATIGTNVQIELAKNFNYYFDIPTSPSPLDPRWTIPVNYVNLNPQIPISGILFRGNNGSLILDQSLPSTHYLQNAAGQFIKADGSLAQSTQKVWRPTAPTNSYSQDGTKVYNQFSAMTQLTRNFSLINENAELFPHLSNTALALDPVVATDRSSTGLSWGAYLGLRIKDNETQAYRNVFMTHPKAAGAKFTEYTIGGHPTYQPDYAIRRMINDTINNQYYSTNDFYPRWPNNWRYWQSAWHGWQWFVESRHTELQLGDKYFSPFISAGWDHTESNNIRPAQWLGLLKSLNNFGAEFYYTGFFSLAAPWPDSRNWLWQSVMPSYAQATASHYEDLYRNSYIMQGDVPASWSSSPTTPGYTFNAKDPRKLITVRKHNTANKYIIVGTFQPNSNMHGNTSPSATATITLDNQPLTFAIRRQGSTYIYDKTTTPHTFYQVDAWHEASHPSRWSKDIHLEAEVADTAVVIKTEPTINSDYSNFTSYIAFDNTTSKYNVTTRTSGTYYLFVRARHISPANSTAGRIGVQMNSDTARFIGCIYDTTWQWYKYQTCFMPIQYVLPAGNHTLRLSLQNDQTLVDKIVLSTNPLLYNTQLPCSTNCSTLCTTSNNLVNNSVASTTATISWGATNAPLGYKVKVKNFTTNIITYYNVPVGVTTLTIAVQPGTRYRWWVASKCTATQNSSYSTFKSFITPLTMARVRTTLYTVQIYPNPADEYVNVKITSPYSEGVKISLFDYSGQFIQSKEVWHETNSITTVRLENVPPGIYLIFVNSENIQYVEQLVIIRE
jgi:hypothetical protein